MNKGVMRREGCCVGVILDTLRAQDGGSLTKERLVMANKWTLLFWGVSSEGDYGFGLAIHGYCYGFDQ